MPMAGLELISPSYGLDHYTLDKPLKGILRYYLGDEPRLESLGRLAGREILESAYRVDLQSNPLLVSWDYRGSNPDLVMLDPYERLLLERLVWDEGVNRHPFEGRPWHLHYAGIYLVGDPGYSCILTITIQTAYALYKYSDPPVRDAYRGLAGLEKPLLWGATWFTEVQGGSDLGANETRAEPGEGGVWRLTGYKYFASGAGLADWALVTARPPGSRLGAKGLALYAVPREWQGRLNYRVRRLKLKSGTVAVPTGEVELSGSVGYLLGEAEKGIYYTLEDLMVSRLSNSVGAVGIARKAYLEAYGYASVRRAFGRLIKDHPLLARDLLEMELHTEAATILAFRAVSAFDKAWRDTPPYTRAYHYARLLTHIAKNFTADAAAEVTRRAMEVYGGIGFLREFPVERWHREALITPIWEGTSNIQALDMLEAMVKKAAHEPLIDEIQELATSQQEAKLAEEAAGKALATLRELSRDPAGAEWMAKRALTRIAEALSVLLLLDAARRTGDPVFEDVARLYHLMVEDKLEKQPPREVIENIITLRGALEEVDWGARHGA